MLVMWSDEYYGRSTAMGFRFFEVKVSAKKNRAGETMPARDPLQSIESKMFCRHYQYPETLCKSQTSIGQISGSTWVTHWVQQSKSGSARWRLTWRKCGEGTVRLSTSPHYVGLGAVRELKVRRRGEVKSNNTYNPALPAPLSYFHSRKFQVAL